MVSVKDQILRDRKPTSSIMEAIRRKLAGKGKLTIKEKAAIASMNASSGKGGRMKSRRPAGFGMSSSTRKSGTGKARRPEGFGVSSNTRKNITTGGKAKSKERRSGLVPDMVPQERPTTPSGKAGSAAKMGPSGTRKKNTGQARKPDKRGLAALPKSKAPAGRADVGKAGSMPRASAAPKKSKPPMKRPTQAIKDAAKPKPGKPNVEPRTIAQAKKMGKLYFVDKNGKKKAAVTAEDLKKSGHKTLRAYLNAKGKPAKKGK